MMNSQEITMRKKENKLRSIFQTLEKCSYLKEKKKQGYLDKQIDLEE
jgi:hypothetical protein